MRALTEAVALAERAPLEMAVGLIRPFLGDIGWFDAALAGGIAAMAADPMHLPGYRASRNGAVRQLILARTERIWVAATVIDPRGETQAATRIHFSGRHLLCRILGTAAVEGDGYRIEGGRAVATGAVRLAPGALIDRDERRETVRVRAEAAPVLLLRAVIAPPGPVVARLFDAETGMPAAMAQIDEGHARTLMMLSLLRLQERTDAAPLFAAALDMPLPAQRWAMMREYLALDAAAALPALEAMACEETGEVQALARQTLGRIRGEPCLA